MDTVTKITLQEGYMNTLFICTRLFHDFVTFAVVIYMYVTYKHNMLRILRDSS